MPGWPCGDRAECVPRCVCVECGGQGETCTANGLSLRGEISGDDYLFAFAFLQSQFFLKLLVTVWWEALHPQLNLDLYSSSASWKFCGCVKIPKHLLPHL